MLKFLGNSARFVAWFLATLIMKMIHIPDHVRNFLKDHCQWYRRLQGGTWLQWNGFWEKADTTGGVIYRRGRVTVNLFEGIVNWDFHQVLMIGSSVIDKMEDYVDKP